MALSMRTFLVSDAMLPEPLRAGIASRDPDSARQLMELGINECEAAELLDEPCTGARFYCEG